MAESRIKRCVVAYATREHQYLWTVDLPERATIEDALRIARGLAATTLTTRGTREEINEVPWDSAPVGIFGEPRDRRDVPGDGDRIEIYRPLRSDPRERRRARVRQDRRSKQG
jgi:putative ubiquitin-RnfH superfamily antitoxin RatB of RatAB toxin-antitoxin module